MPLRADASPRRLLPPDLNAAIGAGIASFTATLRGRPSIDRDVAVLGRRLRLRFAEPELAEALMGTFSHRRLRPGPAPGHARGDAPDDAPDLTILAWNAPPDAWMTPLLDRVEYVPPEGATESFTAGGVTVQVRSPPAPAVLAIDVGRRIALSWTSGDKPTPPWERCRPFMPILHWWLAQTPWQLVHAAAVGNEHGGVLIAGKGGSGKSTTALACLRAGWKFAGDDFVLIAPSPSPNGTPRIEALYGSARLRPDMARRFPELARLRMPSDDPADADKHDYLLGSALEAADFTGFAARAVLVPCLTGSKTTTLVPASRAEALRALAPTTLGMLKGEARLAFEKISSFVAAVPCFRLDLGPDLDALPAAIAAAIGGAR